MFIKNTVSVYVSPLENLDEEAEELFMLSQLEVQHTLQEYAKLEFACLWVTHLIHHAPRHRLLVVRTSHKV